jgi:hypothetical protein
VLVLVLAQMSPPQIGNRKLILPSPP